jgi:adenosine deaminase CECR1
MPKGALLHIHLDATVDANVLFRMALCYPLMHVRTQAVITSSNIVDALPEFMPLAAPEDSVDCSLTHQSYTPGAWVPLSVARERFDPAMGGPEGFDKWVIGSMTINPSEAHVTHNTITKVCTIAG